MKYCSHCGNELFDQAVVCPKCGNQVREFNYSTNSRQQTNTTTQPTVKKTNTMCLAGFILSFIIPIVGLILSCIGKSQVAQSPEQDGETLAKAGIIISAVRLGLDALGSITSVILVLIFGGLMFE